MSVPMYQVVAFPDENNNVEIISSTWLHELDEGDSMMKVKSWWPSPLDFTPARITTMTRKHHPPAPMTDGYPYPLGKWANL